MSADQADYVALSSGEFRAAYDTFSAGMAGKLPFDPSFPASLPNTAFNRASYAAGKRLADEARRLSFGARIQRVLPIALERKYAKYVNQEAGWFHLELLTAMATVRFSSKTTIKTLRVAFDAEFRRQLGKGPGV